MLKSILFSVFICTAYSCSQPSVNQDATNSEASSKIPPAMKIKVADYAMVIHGGAGTILKENMTDAKEKAYTEALDNALSIGEKILKDGGSSMDAVVNTIKYLEDIPLFNAGKGAVFTHQGTNSLDASIMNGADKNAGAVSGVSTVKNPITGAKAVMENSKHVFLSGKGADQFCKEQNLEIVDNKYFFTQNRYDALQRIIEKEKSLGEVVLELEDSKFGTVGAVALDKNGNIVAGTSTGGMTNKKHDRIGDSPVIGAGTYADNNTCGVSCTGHGEYFIRYAVAHDVSAMMEYGGSPLAYATNQIIKSKLVNAGGSGGLIALDKYGNIAMPFNTAGMYRGYVTNKKRYIGIYKDEAGN